MANSKFDPYHQWLSIPPEEQPANHYRLLGLKTFESNADIIDSAAQRQITYVRSFSLGQHAEESQAILNELATARATLLKASYKAEYDKQLTAKLQTSSSSANQDLPPGDSVPKIAPAPRIKSHETRSVKKQITKAQPQKKRSSNLIFGVVGIAGFLVVAALISWTLSSSVQPNVAELPVNQPTNPGSASSRTADQNTSNTATEESPKTRKQDEEPLASSLEAAAAVGGDSSKDDLEATEDPAAQLASGNDDSAANDTDEVTVTVNSNPATITLVDEAKAKSLQASWAKKLGVPIEFTNSIGMRLRVIPPGTFMMGTKEQAAKLATITVTANVHQVTLTQPYAIGIHEVTQAQYKQITGVNPSKRANRPDHPVELINWDDAVEFCRKLSERPSEKAAGLVYRLPTEAEWEHACRAGTTGKYYFRDDRGQLDDYGWISSNSNQSYHAVGQKQPNEWGLYDMYGNVGEWCHDWYEDFASLSVTDPTGPSSGRFRIIRGGGWRSVAVGMGSAFRGASTGNYRNHPDVGFRVAVNLAEGGHKLTPSLTQTVSAEPPNANAAIGELPGPDSPEASEPTSRTSQSSTRRRPPPPSADAPFDANAAKRHQRDWGRHLRLPMVVNNSVGMRFALVPPGKFTMGSPAEENEEIELGPHRGSAKPSHQVTLPNPLYFGIHEVTRQQLAFVMNDQANRNASPTLPAGNVSWNDATAFCRKLSELPLEKSNGRVYRLPTEAEWEYVCRAGSTAAFFWGDDLSRIPEFAWVRSNSGRQVRNIGTRYANPWGIHDLHGNLWEWCQDWFGPYAALENNVSPKGPTTGKFRVLRGGAFNDDGVSSAWRNMNQVDLKHNLHGMRVVLEVKDGSIVPEDDSAPEAPGNSTSDPIPGNPGANNRTSNGASKKNQNKIQSEPSPFFLGAWTYQVNGTSIKASVTLNSDGTVTWINLQTNVTGQKHWTVQRDQSLLISDAARVKGTKGWHIAYFPAPSGVAVCDDWSAGKAKATLTRVGNARPNSGEAQDSWIVGKWSYRSNRTSFRAQFTARSDGTVEWIDGPSNRSLTKYWSQYDSSVVLISDQPGVKSEQGWHLIGRPGRSGRAQCDDWGGGVSAATATRQR